MQPAQLKKRMTAARYTYHKCVEYSMDMRTGSKSKMVPLLV
jgi:hypothetical protein